MTNKEALEILKSWDGYMFLEREEGCVGYSYKKEVSQEAIDTAIRALQHETPEGKWVVTKLPSIHSEDVYCPFCNARPTRSEYGYYLRDNFCHECGADLRGDKE